MLRQQNITRRRKRSINHLHRQAVRTFCFLCRAGRHWDRKDLPVFSALTILGHLLKTGKAKPDDNVGEVIVVQSVDDVLPLDPGFGMSTLQESFLRPDNVTVFVKKLTDQAASHGKHIGVSIFTTTLHSFAMCSDCFHHQFLLVWQSFTRAKWSPDCQSTCSSSSGLPCMLFPAALPMLSFWQFFAKKSRGTSCFAHYGYLFRVIGDLSLLQNITQYDLVQARLPASLSSLDNI